MTTTNRNIYILIETKTLPNIDQPKTYDPPQGNNKQTSSPSPCVWEQIKALSSHFSRDMKLFSSTQPGFTGFLLLGAGNKELPGAFCDQDDKASVNVAPKKQKTNKKKHFYFPFSFKVVFLWRVRLYTHFSSSSSTSSSPNIFPSYSTTCPLTFDSFFPSMSVIFSSLPPLLPASLSLPIYFPHLYPTFPFFFLFQFYF